ncbi:MAG TPA: hypothetical protein V6D18_11275, partial [Thermosynechococcaceae cyanobacterium]
MNRLSDRAFEILQAEVRRLTGDDPIGRVQREIALKRLGKLRQPGTPASLDDLRDVVVDLFPDFSEKVLKAANRANRAPVLPWKGLRFAAIAVGGLSGTVWVLNLPYPMIRYPVSRIAPIVLLPSFISMDSNYRQAIANTEQADQLINQSTSAADIELGGTKVKAAQKNLDALPVWFLGYYPQAYCGWFGCGWRFTLDEFQQARKEVARMDAKVFQEKNAQAQFQQAEKALETARQEYQEAPNSAERQVAIAQWQQAIDLLHQLPDVTLAGRAAKTKLQAYDRDFNQVAGSAKNLALSGNFLQAAKEFANSAQQLSAGEAHSAIEWEEIKDHWETAIARLEQIKATDSSYSEAQKLQASYRTSLSKTQSRLDQERKSVQAFEQAEDMTERFLKMITEGAKS